MGIEIPGTGGSGGGSPTGAASGDLSASYPNPTVSYAGGQGVNANTIQFTGSANGVAPIVAAIGASDANVNLNLMPKGSGYVNISDTSNGNILLNLTSANGTATSFQITNTDTGGHIWQFGSGATSGSFLTYDATLGQNPFIVTNKVAAILQGGVWAWSTSNQYASVVYDTGLSRTAAATVAVGNGTQGDTSGSLALSFVNLATAAQTLTGTTAGSASYYQPFRGTAYKKVVVAFAGYENNTTTNQTITYPTAFTSTPVVIGNNTGLTISTTTTTLTITAPNNTTTFSGTVLVEGL